MTSTAIRAIDDRVVVGEAVEPGEHPGGDFEHAGDHRIRLSDGVVTSGTGSNPDGPNGRQRARRRTVRRRPRAGAVELERLVGVARTRRVEPARRWPALERRADTSRSPRSSQALRTGRRHASCGVRRSRSSRSVAARSEADRTSVRRRRAGADQQHARRAAASSLARRQQRPQPPAEPVARHGGPDGAADRERHARRRRSTDRDTTLHHSDGAVGSACRRDGRRSNASRSRIRSDQADRRARPLARRFLSTARPARVAHPGAKAVLAGTTTIVGLERALHADLLDGLRHA